MFIVNQSSSGSLSLMVTSVYREKAMDSKWPWKCSKLIAIFGHILARAKQRLIEGWNRLGLKDLGLPDHQLPAMTMCNDEQRPIGRKTKKMVELLWGWFSLTGPPSPLSFEELLDWPGNHRKGWRVGQKRALVLVFHGRPIVWMEEREKEGNEDLGERGRETERTEKQKEKEKSTGRSKKKKKKKKNDGGGGGIGHMHIRA